ncbi:MAG: transposase [Bacillota bacterium]
MVYPRQWVSRLGGAGGYERTQEREGHRNGHRERRLKTRAGELNVQVPRVRGGCGG